MQRPHRALVVALAAPLLLVAPRLGAAEAPPPAASPSVARTADPAFQRAREECMERAARETETVSPQGQATKAAIGIYVECMRAKGFPVHGR